MGRPPILPTWATATTYPAGGFDWSGQPPRVQPTAGVLAQGFTPATDMPAEYDNWLYGLLFDWINYSDSAAPTWWRENLMCAGSTFTTQQNPIPNYAPLAFIMSGTGAQSVFQDPSTVGTPIYSGRTAALTPGSAAAAFGFLSSSFKIAGFASPANLLFNFEVDVMFANIASTNTTYYVGIGDSQNIPTSTHWVAATRTSGVWSLTSDLSSLGTGITPTNGVFQRLQVMAYGASTPQGIAAGSAGVKLFINGTLAATLTSVPASNAYFSIGGSCTGAGATAMTIGNWTACWNRY